VQQIPIKYRLIAASTQDHVYRMPRRFIPEQVKFENAYQLNCGIVSTDNRILIVDDNCSIFKKLT